MPVMRFELVEGIVARLRPRRGAPRRVGEVLLRRQRVSLRRVFHVGVAVHVHRQHALTRIHTIERRMARAAVPPAIVFRTPTPSTVAPATATPGDQVIQERLVARELRREMLTRDRHVTIAREIAAIRPRGDRSAADAARPIEFVLRRAATVAEKDERGRPIADARPQVFARAQAIDAVARQTASSSTIPLSPNELARLTDDVVYAIDRRIVAHRERRGGV